MFLEIMGSSEVTGLHWLLLASTNPTHSLAISDSVPSWSLMIKAQNLELDLLVRAPLPLQHECQTSRKKATLRPIPRTPTLSHSTALHYPTPSIPYHRYLIDLQHVHRRRAASGPPPSQKQQPILPRAQRQPPPQLAQRIRCDGEQRRADEHHGAAGV